MTTSYSFEEILERQCGKLQDLETATMFINSKNAIKEEFLEMHKEVLFMSNGIEIMRRRLNDIKEQNDQCTELLSLIKALHKKIIHMERNVPPELIRDYQSNENSLFVNITPEEEVERKSLTIIDSDMEEQETPMKDCKKILFNEPEVCPMISLIYEDEFSTIPKYIIGRQSLVTLNSLINTINQILKTKYTFLLQGKAHARKQGCLNLYLHYKKQELDVCGSNEYVYFFTGEDYERYTKSKLDKIKLNLLTVLRHCKRLRQHKVKNDTQYVVIAKR